MNKLVVILVSSLFFAAVVNGQEVFRADINLTGKPAKPDIQQLKQDRLDINRLIDSFNRSGDTIFLGSVKNLAATIAVKNSFFEKYNDSLVAVLNRNRQDINNVQLPRMDSIPLESLKEKGEDEEEDENTSQEKCGRIKAIKQLKVEKNEDAEYVIGLVDGNDNPLESFVIKQFNEKLFADKLESSLYGLCGDIVLTQADSIPIKNLLAQLSKQKLYEKMLEASLEVNDENVLAGVLKINKKVQVYIVDEKTRKELRKEKQVNRKKGLEVNGQQVSLVEERGGVFGVSSISTGKEYMDTMVHPKTLPINMIPRKDTVFKTLIIHEVQIQFQDGFIENLKVLGNFEGERMKQRLKFENALPIAFSTRKDFRKLYDKSIFERTIYARGNTNRCYFKLGDLIFYSQSLQLNTKDYSPANQVVYRKITKDPTTVNLFKERTSKILELKVFSDLKGIDNDTPNGLVQFELSKKFNFLTQRGRIFKNTANIGFFNYVTPMLSMNKIEDNNKRLTPAYIGTNGKDTSTANVYASSLSLLQYQVFSVGGNLNLVTLDIPGLKSTLSINIGAYWGRVLFQDTLRNKVDSASFSPIADNNINQFGLNSIQFVPEVCWQIFPDKRYGVVMSQRFSDYNLQSRRIRQIRDSSNYISYINSLKGDRSGIENYSYQKWLGITEIYAFFMPSDYNKLFFRYRFNWDLANIKNNFHQVQVGISTYLTHTRKPKPKGNEEPDN